MIRLAAFALWCAVIGLSASYAAAYWRMHKQDKPSEVAEKPVIEQKKTRIINVPMISGGQVQGYIVAQFAYTIDQTAAKKLPGNAENYILDEAFRTIYADDKLDYRRLNRFDVTSLANELQARVTQRMGGDALKELLVHEFNFVPREMIRQ